MKQLKNLMINWLFVLSSPIWIIPAIICDMIEDKEFVEQMIEGETRII